MTNKRIPDLTAATTPLAGTELVPVWDGTTKKVAVDDLTVKNIRSNATSGILQIAGPAAASTRVVTVPNANWTAARTDAAQSFTGDQTLVTGNLTQGTAAKGIDFIANTPTAGMTSQLLNWYEEGTWTPTDASGAGLTFTQKTGKYTRNGRNVLVEFFIEFPSTVNTNNAKIGGLPFQCSGFTLLPVAANTSVPTCCITDSGSSNISILSLALAPITNVALSSVYFYANGSYSI